MQCRSIVLLVSVAGASWPTLGRANEDATPRTSTTTASAGETGLRFESKDGRLEYELNAFVEVYYTWNFNEPSNGVNAFRIFNPRHNTFGLSTAAIENYFRYDRVFLNLALWFGDTPNVIYDSEPTVPGGDGVPESNSELWRIIQQANVGWVAPLGRGLELAGGLFVSPISIESIRVHENYNWSSAYLLYFVPFYFVGAQAKYPIAPDASLTVGVYNGYANAVNDNGRFSVVAAFEGGTEGPLEWKGVYYGGFNSAEQFAEPAWLSMFELAGTLDLHPAVLAVDLNGGFEPSSLGTTWWVGSSLYTAYKPFRWLWLAARGELFREEVAEEDGTVAPAVLTASPWLGSVTGTVDFKPAPNFSFRLEYRWEQATNDVFFTADGVGSTQNTITAGTTAWF